MGGLLHGIAGRLQEHVSPLEYFKEVYTIDALLVGGEDLFRKDLCYPSRLHAMIEHEQGEWLEEEMWKLIFWRCPLKVLIFYDWNDDKKSTPKRRKWLEKKLEELRRMLSGANADSENHDNAEYLFLIGNQEISDEEINWRWASIKQVAPIKFLPS